MTKYLVYKVINNVNDKIYIGVHKTDDVNDGYLGSGKILKRAIDKYGPEHFTKEILYECETQEEMFQREADIVDEEFVTRKDTYNIKLGGCGGFDHLNYGSCKDKNLRFDNEWMRSISPFCNKKLRDKIHKDFCKMLRSDDEYRKKYCEKVSKGLKKYYENNESPFKGKKHTAESRNKIGKANSLHQSGEGNSQFGKKWIYSDKEKKSMSVNKEELNGYLEQGWVIGRKMKW